MAKAKKTAETGNRGVTIPDDIELMDEGGVLDPALEKVFNELGTDGTTAANIYVYKTLADGREARIWNGPPSDYDLQELAKRFGSGDYRVKIYVQGETGRMGLAAGGNKVIPILLDPADDQRVRELRENKPATLAGAAQPVITAEAIALAVAAALKQSAPPVPAGPTAFEMMREFAGIAKVLMPQQPVQQLNPMDMLRGVMEVARASTPDAPDPIERGTNATGMDLMLKVVDKFAPLFEKMAQTALTQPAAGTIPPALMPPANGVDNVAASGAPVIQPVTPTNQDADPMFKLKMGLMFLCQQAAAQNDPVTYADVILDNVPEDALADILNKPEWLAELSKHCADCSKYPTWFAQLRDAVLDELNAEDTPDDADPDKAQLTDTTKTGNSQH